MNEHQEQAAVVRWAAMLAAGCPPLRLLFAIPNGGARHIVVARKLKAEGVRAGVPDLFLPHPAGDFHGLFLEMKTAKGRVSADQLAWLSVLSDAGYATVIAYTAPAAIEAIQTYLAGDLPAGVIKRKPKR